MFRILLRRLLALIPLVAVIFLMIGFTQPASAVVPNGTASIGDVQCDDNEQGTLPVTLVADPTTDTEFMLLVNGVSEGDNLSIPVPAGESNTVQVSNLDDGNDVSIEVIVMGTAGEDGKTVFRQDDIVVACDTPPTESYTNPKGSVYDACDGIVSVTASNKPIGNNVEDLQPVAFKVTFVANDSSTVRMLDTFTLPSGEDDAFDTKRSYSPGAAGVVTLYADDVALQHTYFTNSCVVVPDVVHPTKHHPQGNNPVPPVTMLPNTGLSVHQWQALCGFALLLAGGLLVKVSRRPVRVRVEK